MKDSIWREVARVVLHENYTILTGRDVEPATGIFADYEQDMWHVDGDELTKLFRNFGFNISEALHKEGLSVFRVPSHCGQNVYGVISKQYASNNPMRIEACIEGPHLLMLRIFWNEGADAYIQEVAYCGTFTVEWHSKDAVNA